MAYVSKEKKAKVADLLKKEFGTDAKKRGFKYSLSINHHSSLVITISRGSIDFIGNFKKKVNEDMFNEGYIQVNHYHLDSWFTGDALKILKKIKDIMNTDNHNNSDIMTDYFDVGHYIDINIGSYDKPYILEAK